MNGNVQSILLVASGMMMPVSISAHESDASVVSHSVSHLIQWIGVFVAVVAVIYVVDTIQTKIRERNKVRQP